MEPTPSSNVDPEATVDGARASPSNRESVVSASATVINAASTPAPTAPNGCVSSVSSSSLTEDDSSDDESDARWPDLDHKLEGWPRLAEMMTITADFTAFSRFRDLNIKSLLYYQAQLAKYQEKLHDLEWENAREGKKYNERVDLFVDGDSEQWKTIIEMRKVLKEYNRALIDYSKVNALPTPEPFHMRRLRKWMVHRMVLNGRVRSGANSRLSNTWGDLKLELSSDDDAGLWRRFGRILWSFITAESSCPEVPDLVITSRSTRIDGLTRWGICDFSPFYSYLRSRWRRRAHWRRRNRENPDSERGPARASTWGWITGPPLRSMSLQTWAEKNAPKITSGISTVVACLLPVIAVSVLSQLHGLRNLLLCLAGFAVIFAVGLILLTPETTTRAEIFTATCAFSAVMVVFISQPPAPVINLAPGTASPSISSSLVPE